MPRFTENKQVDGEKKVVLEAQDGCPRPQIYGKFTAYDHKVKLSNICMGRLLFQEIVNYFWHKPEDTRRGNPSVAAAITEIDSDEKDLYADHRTNRTLTIRAGARALEGDGLAEF